MATFNLLVKIFTCLCFAGGPALLGQSLFTSGGTLIVIELDNDRMLAGADSKEVGVSAGQERCKITQLSDNVFFGAAGDTTVMDGNSLGLAAIYDAHVVAKQAFEKFKQKSNSDLRTRQIANEWGRIIKGRIERIISNNPKNPPPIKTVQGVFIGNTFNKEWSIYTINLVVLPASKGKKLPTVSFGVRPSVPTPSNNVAFLGAGGVYAAEFYAGRTGRAYEARRVNEYLISTTPGVDRSEFTMESAINAAEQWAPPEAGVGGDIVVIELKNGSIRWIKECPKKTNGYQ
jgi:hypothetical protein